MIQSLMYASKNRLIASDTVSCDSCALASDAFHRSSEMRMARGVSGIDYLHLRIKACPSTIIESGNRVILRPAINDALDFLAVPSGEHNLSANPFIAVFSTFAGLVSADSGDPGIHNVSLDVDAPAERDCPGVSIGIGDARCVWANLAHRDYFSEGCVNHANLDVPDGDAFHGALPCSCIYSLNYSVYTSQANSENFLNVRFGRVL